MYLLFYNIYQKYPFGFFYLTFSVFTLPSYICLGLSICFSEFTSYVILFIPKSAIIGIFCLIINITWLHSNLQCIFNRCGLGTKIAQVKYTNNSASCMYMIKASKTYCCTYLHTKELDMVYLWDSWQPVWFPVCLSVCLCVRLSLTGENVFMLYLSPAWNQCIYIHPVGCTGCR